MYILQCCGFISGSRPGSTDGDGFPLPAVHHHPHHHQPDHLGRLLHHPSAGGPLDTAQHSQPGRQHTALTGLNLPGAQFRQHLVGGPPGMTAAQEMGLPVAPRIRALQNKLKMADVCDAQGSLV